MVAYITHTLTSWYTIRRLRECIQFFLIVWGVFIVGMVILYFRVFQLEWQYYTTVTESPVVLGSSQDTTLTLSPDVVTDISHISSEVFADLDISFRNQSSLYDYALENYLHNQLDSYTLAFNTLAPWNWLVVDELDIMVPIVDVPYASEEKLEEADFDEELKQGVVKYPFTGKPWQENGHPLIFGHSSVDGLLAKDNPYGYVFYQLPKLSYWSTIKIVWEGEVHEYEVVSKIVKDPDEVNEEITYDEDMRYLTLMACYPLLSDAKRMLVKARYKDDRWTVLAYNDEKIVQ